MMDILRQIATDTVEQAKLESCQHGLRLRLTCSRHSAYSRQVAAAMFFAAAMRLMLPPGSWARLSIRTDLKRSHTQTIEQPARTPEEFNDVLNAMRAACREIGIALDHYMTCDGHQAVS